MAFQAHSRTNSWRGFDAFPPGSAPGTPGTPATNIAPTQRRELIQRMTISMPNGANGDQHGAVMQATGSQQGNHFPSLSRQSSFYGRPPSSSALGPAFFDSVLQEVYAALYASAPSKANIVDVIERLYEVDAIYENPTTMAPGRKRIEEHFCLGTLYPGDTWGELEEVSINGHRCLIFTHTKSRSFLPWLSGETASSHRLAQLGSYPPTPWSGRTPARTPHASPGHEHADFDITNGHHMPAATSIRQKVFGVLSTLHLRMHTTLKFNEQGRIVHHEDIWGIREVLESLPLVWPIYYAQRRAVGLFGGVFSRTVVMRGQKEPDEEADGKGAEPRTRFSSPAVSRKGSIAGLALEHVESPPMAPTNDVEVPNAL